MAPSGQLKRRNGDETVPFVYAGVAIVKPELAQHTPEGPFSANYFYDSAIARERLFGLELDGQWLHGLAVTFARLVLFPILGKTVGSIGDEEQDGERFE